ncbi:hypothetical protein [Prescottella equi]|uniref:hypothetical protein n=1 Tax=Rhodococcus hoagii TaxID=43767 RepID=UPI00384A7C8B
MARLMATRARLDVEVEPGDATEPCIETVVPGHTGVELEVDRGPATVSDDEDGAIAADAGCDGSRPREWNVDATEGKQDEVDSVDDHGRDGDWVRSRVAYDRASPQVSSHLGCSEKAETGAADNGSPPAGGGDGGDQSSAKGSSAGDVDSRSSNEAPMRK